ncbi:glycine N-phenylacetyltransferase-like isoform X1 [Phyllostomus discolor]|uniref:Glycine N-acyltransferase-like protein n=1 Tax=Phyllostomus discolor TaxID=89673 RepID=A0A7E6E247_9CHIR|nr:glycine N-phenylacetyltransferase-like isoform X1 [Phyllostomus discolor]
MKKSRHRGVPAKMFQLQGPQMLQMLEKSLRNFLPESLKVYGTVFHMIKGNSFNLKALVDKWPDFNTVVVRPQEEEMRDDFDHYTNTYQIYSKNPQNCQEFLGRSDVINWKQHLQIQSTQFSLNEAIQNLAVINRVQVKPVQCILYLESKMARRLLPSLPQTNNLPLKYGKLKTLNEDMFSFSSLSVTHAALVNKFWHFGGNEKSQRFIERCIQSFPALCLLGPDRNPVCWGVMDQTGEMRMGATVPEYRGQGLVQHIMFAYFQALEKLGFPIYFHTDRANHTIQKTSKNMPCIPMPCDWNQWKCVPL